MMRSKKGTCWSFTAGEAPYTVMVHERVPNGLLYERVWDPSATRRMKGRRVKGAQRRRSLGHRDRERAIQHAQDEARKLRAGAEAMVGEPSVAGVLALYLVHQSRKKVATAQQEDSRRAALWSRFLGTRRISELGQLEWDTFKAKRSSGEISARGHQVSEQDRVTVGARGVDADLVFINSVFNWGLGFKVKGRPLVAHNPFGAPAPGVKRALERPRNAAPQRPVAQYERYLALRKVSDQVLMESRKGASHATLVERGRAQFTRGEGPVRLWMTRSYLSELLDLVEGTGRRIGAVLRLWYSDLVWEEIEKGKIRRRVVTKVRWRPFKQEEELTIVVTDQVARALERVVRERPGFGDTPLFPSMRKSTIPITRTVATEWLRKAEQLAGLERLPRGAFHPFRRKWATERKHHPVADVMKAGSWRDRRSLDNCYTMADDETVALVVNEPRKLRSRTL